MNRKKRRSSGASPVNPPAPSGEIDESWDNVSDSDLIELGRADEIPAPDDAAGQAPEGVPSAASPRATAPDLLAPVGPKPTRGASKPGKRNTLTDLPAPVGPVPRKSIPDLLAPVGPKPSRAPAPPSGASVPEAAAKLPAAAVPSVGPAAAARTALPDEIDLPVPVGPLPTKGLPDLLTPVGPTPTKSGLDLPAPKGFFDDGVQPKQNPGTELPAPKGFFDDGVQPMLPAGRGGPGRGPLDLDLFELSENADLDDAVVAGAKAGAPPALDLGDLPSSGGVNRPFGLDAADLELDRQDEPTPPPIPLELNDMLPPGPPGSVPRSRTSRLEIELGPASGAPPVAGAMPGQGQGLASGMAAAMAADPMRGRPASDSDDPFSPTRAAGHLHTTEIKLELDAAQAGGAPLPPAVMARRPSLRTAEVARRPAPVAEGRRHVTLFLAGALVATALGAAAYYGWGWWESYKTRGNRAATGLRQVERLLAEDSPSHWEQAASEARQAQGSSGDNFEALAVVAEASFAAALDESPQAAERIKEGDQALDALRARSGKGQHAAKAEALRAVLSTNFDLAVTRLEELARATPADGEAPLYLGWALAAEEQHGPAAAAFTTALARAKQRIPALYGLALSQLELGDKDAARKSFQAVIDASRDRYKRDHLGALIGLAQLAPVSERESRYQELLARPDLATAPPRAVSRLRTLAGDEALRAGRLDQARTRYNEARTLDPLNLRASVGLALVAARSGDLAAARKKLTADVLEVAPNHIEGALALIDMALAARQRDEAAALVDSLFARRPPIANRTLLGRAYLARARLYDSAPDPTLHAKAETEYREAMARADEGDFTATVGLSSLLMRLGRKQEGLDVLGPVKAAAKEDPGLALTLGGAYLAAGQPDDAVEAFRSVLARRPDDAEALLQLGHAYLAGGKYTEAIDSLRKAYEIDPSREDIGLDMARTLEAGGRTGDAVAAFDKMLDGGRKPSIAVRAQAGRMFARLGMAVEAAAQGEAIRKEEPGNSAGQFLLGEKLYREGKYEAALDAYREATRLESNAQYFEALGRVSEKLAQPDDALRYYGDASAAEPRYLAPRLGRGRVRLARREFALAVTELTAALKVAPDNPAVLRDLGIAYLRMHDLQHGVPLLERAATLDPRDGDAQYELGGVYYDSDRRGLAIERLSRAVELASPDRPWRAEALRQLGYVLRAAGNRSGAISAWRRYLTAERVDSAERRDVQRLLMRLEASGR